MNISPFNFTLFIQFIPIILITKVLVLKINKHIIIIIIKNQKRRPLIYITREKGQLIQARQDYKPTKKLFDYDHGSSYEIRFAWIVEK